jgi:hypothetical protein
MLELAGVLEGVEVLRQRRQGASRSLVTSSADRDPAAVRLLVRSAKAFARVACGGILITSTSSAANTASKTAVNFVSRSRRRNRSPATR